MGRLERHIDPDALARALAKVPRPVKPLKRVKLPRRAWTYRAARRNALRGKEKLTR